MKQIKKYSDLRLYGYCTYCGGEPETRDHVPSKILLDKPFPENLPVVPSCDKCNHDFSKDEEYFACLIECTLRGTTEPEKLIMSFEEVRKEEFLEIIEWLFISKSFKITHIRADEKIYDLLERFKDPKNNDDVYLVPDFLANFSFAIFDESIVDRFFEGILKFDHKKVSYGLFHMAKVSVEKPNKIYQRFTSGRSPPLLLFERLFLPKILEVEPMIDENLRDACIDVAKSIGRSFSENVGMMTKFAYASDPGVFKQAIEDATFRLAKQSALEKRKSNYVSEESLKIVFDSLDPEKFSDIKNYFVSFMSVAALSKNYSKSKKEE